MNFQSFLAGLGIIDPLVQAAVLEGMAVAIALLIAGLLIAGAIGGTGRRRHGAQLQARRKEARAFQNALLCEVRAQWYDIDGAGAPEVLAAPLLERIDHGRWVQTAYSPLLTAPPASLLTQRLERNLVLLDEEVLPPAVAYHRQLTLVRQQVDRIGSPLFQGQPSETKSELIKLHFEAVHGLKNAAAVLHEKLELALKLKSRNRDSRIQQQAATKIVVPPPAPVENATVRDSKVASHAAGGR